MARNSGILTSGIRGAIGNSIVYKQVNGKTIATSYPDRSQVKFTSKQVDYQNIFAAAAAYASAAIHDPEKNQAYLVKIRNGSKSVRGMDVYHYAIREYMQQHSKKVTVVTIAAVLKKYDRAFQLDGCESAVVKYLAAQGEMSNADYRRMTGVSKPTATRHLKTMVQKGLITGSSRGAGAIYVLAPLAKK